METERVRYRIKAHDSESGGGVHRFMQKTHDSDTPITLEEHNVPGTDTVEIIRDIVSPKRFLGAQHVWHPVSHVKVNCLHGSRPTSFIYPPVWDLFSSPTIYVYAGEWQDLSWSQFPYETAYAFVGDSLSNREGLLPSSVAGEHSRRALLNILDQVPATVSIANFLWELRDGVKSLLPSIKSWATAVGSLWLWWNFAALPLVRDIKALLSSIGEVYKRLEYLKKVNGKTVTVNYTGIHSIARETPPTGPEQFDFTRVFAQPSIAWDEYKLRMHARVAYDLNLQGADVFFNAMVKALGLYDPAQIIWEAIPFSFVVDWFVRVSDWLEDNIDTAQPFEGTIKIVGCDHSITRRLMMEYYVATDNRGGVESIASTLVRAYYRREGTFGGTLDTSGLTPLQQSLALALLQQGVGSRPHTRRH